MKQTTRNLQSLLVFFESLKGWSIKTFDGPGKITVLWADPDMDDQTNWCNNNHSADVKSPFQCVKRTPTAEKVLACLGCDLEDVYWWKVNPFQSKED